MFCVKEHDRGGAVHARGQSLVEFAILLPLLIMLVVGGIEIGRIYHAVITLTNAAREGARYAVLKVNMQNGIDLMEASAIQTAAANEAQSSGVQLYPANVTPSCPSGCASGYPVRVVVTYNFNFLMQSFFPDGLTLRRQIEMVIP